MQEPSAFKAIAPSDTVDLPTPTRAIYVGGVGDVTAIPTRGDGGGVTFKAVPVGTILWIGASRVLATGTTATNLVALY